MGLPSNTNALQNGFAQGYQIGRSLRFRSSASAYLSRTPSVAGNRQTWTLSFWMKRGALSTASVVFSAGSNTSNNFALNWRGFDALDFYDQTASVNNTAMTTNAVYRDPSAWYHIVFVFDTTQATSTNRWKSYVNGVQITSFSATTYPSQNYQGYVNSTVPHYFGVRTDLAQPFDGYLAEVNFIDGQALTPSSFGLYDSNGIWQPIKYTGTYGTNGFYLPFSNTTSTTTLVADASGNGNNWTANNISLTAGTTYDSMLDSPTVSSVSSNYCVMNPLKSAGSNGVNSGNLNFGTTADGAGNSGDNSGAFGSIAVNSGKWYFEATKLNTTTNCNLPGFASTNCIIGTDDPGLLSSGKDFFGFSWNSGGTVKLFIRQGGVSTNIATGITQAQNDVFALAIDLTNNTIAGYKNGVQQGSTTAFTATTNFIAPCVFQTTTFNYAGFAFNFGQRPFAYTPPAGYNALNTANLPQPLISNGANYMAASTWTGDGTSPRTFTNGGNNTLGTTFQPDLVWIKMRSGAYQHVIADSVRGGNAILHSNSTSAEDVNWQYGYLQSFNSNGFTAQSGSTSIENINLNGSTFVGWQWKAGAGTTSTNTSGSITTTVSVNQSAGFSIATFTAQTSGSATFGHGLGVAPNLIFVKARANAYGWTTYHSSVGNTAYLVLNSTAAQATDPNTWNNTSPTSTVFTLGQNFINTGTWVAYCFAAVNGYSAFGSYTGNGSSDGPFIFTGHRPRWVMVKKSSAIGNWLIFDTSRSPFNVNDDALFPNLSNAETTTSSYNNDFLSNGFKIRTSDGSWNDSGVTYIYASFAESPFNISRGR